jgi:hypothetical protein
MTTTIRICESKGLKNTMNLEYP